MIAKVGVVVIGGAAVAAIMLAAPASADGLTAQSGSSVDTDGTQGDWRSATAGGMNTSERPLTTNTSTGHQITSDACYVKGGGPYCPPPMKSDSEMIQESNGTSDDADSKMMPGPMGHN